MKIVLILLVVLLNIIMAGGQVIEYYGNELKARAFNRGIATGNQRVFVEQMVRYSLSLIYNLWIMLLTRSTRRAQTSLAEADHYSHNSQCNNVESWWWKADPKGLDHYLHHNLGMLPLLWCLFCSFTHLRIPRSLPNVNQFFIVLPRTPP